MKLKELICRLCNRPNLPIWAYGLECEVCGMSFGSARLHYEHVLKNKLKNKHKGKIPQLR